MSEEIKDLIESEELNKDLQVEMESENDMALESDTVLSGGKISRTVFSVLITALVFLCIWKLYELMVRDQHVVYADAEFFNMVNLVRRALDNGYSTEAILKTGDVSAWSILIGYACNMFGQDPLVLCHKYLSIVFFAAFVFIYALLGIRLFKRDKKGAWHIYNSTCFFLCVVIYLSMKGYYSKYAVEAGVIGHPWYGMTIAGMLITPLAICTIIRFGDGLKKCKEKGSIVRLVFLFVSCLIMFVIEELGFVACATFDNIAGIQNSFGEESGLAYFYDTYFDYKWVLFLAIGMLIYLIVSKRPAWVPVVLGVLISVAFLTPLPLAVVIGYGAAKLAIAEKKESFWTIMALLSFGFMFYMLGRVEGTDVQRKYEFERAENPYKIPQDAIDVSEFIMEQGNEVRDMSVTTYEYMYYSIGQYTPFITCRRFDNDNDDDMTATHFFWEGMESGYTLLHTSKEVTQEDLEEAQYGVVKVFDEYTLYAKTAWVETDSGWMHTAGDGSEYLGQGWHKIDGRMYYFDETGVMQSGWVEVDGQKYYLQEEGGLKTLWQQIDDNWYYFDESGVMQHDCEIEGYQLGPDGTCEDY